MSLLDVDKPSLPERLQPFPLLSCLLGFWIVEPDHRQAGIAENIDVRAALPAARLDRRKHFVGRPARIGTAVRQTGHEARRQVGSDPMAENANHDVAFGRFRDLRLKAVNGAIELCLPADGLDPGSSAIGETLTRCADSPSPTSCCRRR
jgi:hypothetical protein